MSSTLEIRINRTPLNKLLKKIDELNSKHVLVGILDDAPAGLAEVAYKNEFGASAASTDLGKDIPERSFIREPIEHRGDGILEASEEFDGDFWENLVKSQTSVILGSIAEVAAEEIVNQIVENQPNKKPNSPYTLQGKSSTIPLKDKGVLEGNIKWKEVSSK